MCVAEHEVVYSVVYVCDCVHSVPHVCVIVNARSVMCVCMRVCMGILSLVYTLTEF